MTARKINLARPEHIQMGATPNKGNQLKDRTAAALAGVADPLAGVETAGGVTRR